MKSFIRLAPDLGFPSWQDNEEKGEQGQGISYETPPGCNLNYTAYSTGLLITTVIFLTVQALEDIIAWLHVS